MSLDPSPLATFVAEFMDDLEKEYGEDATLIDAVICVEISTGEEDFVQHRSIEDRATSEIGILTMALEAGAEAED